MKHKLYVDHSLSADVLREGRMALGLTQRGFADQLHMEPGTYSSCENGKRRFPIQRLQLLPRDLALKVRDALVEEFGMHLDDKLNRRQQIRNRGTRRSKALAATQAAAVD